MHQLTSIAEVEAAVGTRLGAGEWTTITQDRIDLFAGATDDHQWIHTDPERAADGPFGATIAHGYLTLSMLPALGTSAFRIAVRGARLNYGLERVRFPTPVRVGSRVRTVVTLDEVRRTDAGHRLTLTHVVEIDGQDKPACAAQVLLLLLTAP